MSESYDPGPSRLPDRHETMEQLASQEFDLLVIGAGIIGSRVAYEAAKSGGNVALVDAGDFGGATSSASSKLIHGGLRYLETHDFGLVREAHLERRRLLGQVAPHLIRPLRFVLPAYRGGPHAAPVLFAGLAIYAALSGFRHTRLRVVRGAAARELVPAVRTDGMLAAGVYEDAQTHDSRLVLATVLGAARAGATVLNHCRIQALETVSGRVVAAVSDQLRIRCRTVVNAAGPWVEHVRRLEDAAAPPMARLSKGVHLVLEPPAEWPWRAAVTAPLPGGRVSFAIPWEGMLLLGTTDTEYEGDPAAVTVEAADVDEILKEAATALDQGVVSRERIRYAFAGLRVLPMDDGSTVSAERKEVIRNGPAGMVSVAGGKLTTHRQIAMRVLRQVPAFGRAGRHDEPLPGAGQPGSPPEDVDPETWTHLVHLYGCAAAEVARLGSERIHPHGPDIWGQVRYAINHEWAVTTEDVLRRTTVAIRGLCTPDVSERIGRMLQTAPAASDPERA